MNAWATMMAGTWLMGECEINDVEVTNEDGDVVEVLKGQGLLVKRCRFLEESGCASVCVNSCKIPTQNFFLHDMGLPLTMTPNYETYECQFEFGVLPSRESELEAKRTPCLDRCPTNGRMRKWHTEGNLDAKSNNKNNNNQRLTTSSSSAAPRPTATSASMCSLMDDDD
jgi:Beta-carotene isomerase D27-like, C-terminal